MGADNSRYIAYYVPCLTWIQQYKLHMLQGDLISALTMASFYLPMALSYASNLAHVPPIHGLYAFVFNPFIYAIFGSCPQMVVGPEAAGSLLVGAAVKSSVDSGKGGHEDEALQATICGIVTGMAGAMVLIAGLVRLGFLDSVLSRPFLRGFISAIGFVIFVDQLIPELGLSGRAEKAGISHGSSVDKIKFIIENIGNAHLPTFAVAGVSFVIIMIARYVGLANGLRLIARLLTYMIQQRGEEVSPATISVCRLRPGPLRRRRSFHHPMLAAPMGRPGC